MESDCNSNLIHRCLYSNLFLLLPWQFRIPVNTIFSRYVGYQRVVEREHADARCLFRCRYTDSPIRRARFGLEVQIRRSSSTCRPSDRGATFWQQADHACLPRISRLAGAKDRFKGSQRVGIYIYMYANFNSFGILL